MVIGENRGRKRVLMGHFLARPETQCRPDRLRRRCKSSRIRPRWSKSPTSRWSKLSGEGGVSYPVEKKHYTGIRNLCPRVCAHAATRSKGAIIESAANGRYSRLWPKSLKGSLLKSKMNAKAM